MDSLLTARQHAEAQYWQASGMSMQVADVEQQWSHLTAVPDPTAHDVCRLIPSCCMLVAMLARVLQQERVST